MINLDEYWDKSKENNLKWDRRFLNIAKEVSTWSKDPSTKVGSIIVKDGIILGTGYNGFPEGIADTPERLNDRAIKYSLMLHAEENAILNSKGNDIEGATIYTYPGACPCIHCALYLIQCKIKECVGTDQEYKGWWTGMDVLKEAGIPIRTVEID